MSNQEILDMAADFLRSHREVALATSYCGEPFMRVFQIMRQQGCKVWFATSPKKQVFLQLQVNPVIEIMAMGDNKMVKLRGKANFEVADELQREIFDANPVLPRLYGAYTDLVYFSLDAERLDYYDLTPQPPLSASITL